MELSWRDGQIQVEVDDKGVGFDPGQLNWGSGSLKGIGLFNIRERLSLLGGRLEIDSAPGTGSRFKLICPGEAASVQTVPQVDNPATGPAPTKKLRTRKPGGRKKIRVLVVDDHLVVRQGLAGLLHARKDMELVGEAADGAAAVKLVRELQPDVVLMDISMPGMNGIEATRIIHRELPDVRVIALSMFQEGEQAVAMRNAGAVAYVTKSSGSDAITDAIRSCVSAIKPVRAK